MPSLARSRCSLAREGTFSSLDVRIGSSPSSGFLKLLPCESDSGGLGGFSFVIFLIDVRFSSWYTEMVEIQCGVCDKRDEMGLAWQSLPGSRSGLGTHRSASDAGGGRGGAFGDLGVGYAGCSQRHMRSVNESAAAVRSCGIDVLRVECVREVSGRVWGSIWGAGAP
jgi:hypothetical protein